jgi:hypothetical protein
VDKWEPTERKFNGNKVAAAGYCKIQGVHVPIIIFNATELVIHTGRVDAIVRPCIPKMPRVR